MATNNAINNGLIGTDTKNINYSLVANDKGRAILSTNSTLSSSGFTYTLLAPATAGAGWYCYFVNQNLTAFGYNFLTPASGTINGQASFQLFPGNSAFVFTDGSNYYVITNQSQYGKINSGDFLAGLPGFYSSTLSDTATQGQAGTINANVLYIPFYVSNNCAIISMTIDVTVSLLGSSATLGIYSSNAQQSTPTGSPLGVVTIATTSLGTLSGTFLTPVQLYSSTTYWAALQTSSSLTLSLGNISTNTDLSSLSAYQAGSVVRTQSNVYSAGTLPVITPTPLPYRPLYLPWISFLPG